ncbi:PASTA domain-containing protein [Streptomyces sp. SID12488]|uniref:PASTA domain-containing protein n=1 Tax=Streptomyces sp. SID12488 TaxID=2706040 RepID=UPI0013D8F6E5|nr:PASTA domain-containing protein [Streptomyces sp. SID12488]NEA67517.1 PASTA domain-containing protein [Streptomyces sp. SID12488]
MRTRTFAAALTAAALLALAGCASTDNTSPSKPDASTQNTDDKPKQDTTTEPDTETPDSPTDADPETAALPDLVGQDLQAAQDEAQAAGFYVLDDQDASGQGRLQVLDRNWTVCSQDPDPGTHPTDTPVTLYAVKDDETC